MSTRRTAVVATLSGVGLIGVLLLGTAPSDSALGQARSDLGSAADSFGDAVSVSADEVESAVPAPAAPTLSPAELEAVALSKAAVPRARALLARATADLDAGKPMAALAEYDRLLEELEVIQPREGRAALDKRAQVIQKRLNAAFPRATPSPG